ncbi:MAG: hypothetical protein Q4C85_07240 [Actinomyces sp.]|uniref:hypothetical protein n=1 Tax=Actinomyces sp. TaxID=29317 RepID=UPI0026DD8F5D|nr:hypothetical protein [Actinomyces sp.]MDO4243537.1 hypothetical protein [Actinomyces sp.]
MQTSQWIALADLVLAMIAAGCAVFSWLYARVSKRARAQAQVARDEAARTLQAVERLAEEAGSQTAQMVRQAEEMARQATASEEAARAASRIAETMTPERLTLQWTGHTKFVLRNNSDAPVSIKKVINRGEFVRLDGVEDGLQIGPRESAQATVVEAWGRPLPADLILDLDGEDSPLVLPLAVGRPEKSR